MVDTLLVHVQSTPTQGASSASILRPCLHTQTEHIPSVHPSIHLSLRPLQTSRPRIFSSLPFSITVAPEALTPSTVTHMTSTPIHTRTSPPQRERDGRKEKKVTENPCDGWWLGAARDAGNQQGNQIDDGTKFRAVASKLGRPANTFVTEAAVAAAFQARDTRGRLRIVSSLEAADKIGQADKPGG
jgi:hypothetical protein